MISGPTVLSDCIYHSSVNDLVEHAEKIGSGSERIISIVNINGVSDPVTTGVIVAIG